MEVKIYLQILLKKWWIVLPIFLVTLVSGIVFTYTVTPRYSATVTYVVVPGTSFSEAKNFASGLDMLGRRNEIATTFTEIAISRSIKELAIASLSLKSGWEYSVSSKLRAGTNIIEIVAEGPDPVIAQQLANAVGVALEEYVGKLYEVFTLVLLDQAKTPTTPISPDKQLNIVLAAVLGLVLGSGLAFLSEYLGSPLASTTGMNIIDDKTGVYNEEYFLLRLGEEMIRAKRNRYPLSLAMMRIDYPSLKGVDLLRIRTDVLRQVAILTSQYLKEEDILAYLKDDVFALLLPDITGENAKALMEYLQTRVAWTPFQLSNNGAKFNLKGIVGITTYNHNGSTRDDLVTQANRALQLAEVDDNGKAYLIAPLTSAS